MWDPCRSAAQLKGLVSTLRREEGRGLWVDSGTLGKPFQKNNLKE